MMPLSFLLHGFGDNSSISCLLFSALLPQELMCYDAFCPNCGTGQHLIVVTMSNTPALPVSPHNVIPFLKQSSPVLQHATGLLTSQNSFFHSPFFQLRFIFLRTSVWLHVNAVWATISQVFASSPLADADDMVSKMAALLSPAKVTSEPKRRRRNSNQAQVRQPGATLLFLSDSDDEPSNLAALSGVNPAADTSLGNPQPRETFLLPHPKLDPVLSLQPRDSQPPPPCPPQFARYRAGDPGGSSSPRASIQEAQAPALAIPNAATAAHHPKELSSQTLDPSIFDQGSGGSPPDSDHISGPPPPPASSGASAQQPTGSPNPSHSPCRLACRDIPQLRAYQEAVRRGCPASAAAPHIVCPWRSGSPAPSLRQGAPIWSLCPTLPVC
jgi:hypothetical protein